MLQRKNRLRVSLLFFFLKVSHTVHYWFSSGLPLRLFYDSLTTHRWSVKTSRGAEIIQMTAEGNFTRSFLILTPHLFFFDMQIQSLTTSRPLKEPWSSGAEPHSPVHARFQVKRHHFIFLFLLQKNCMFTQQPFENSMFAENVGNAENFMLDHKLELLFCNGTTHMRAENNINNEEDKYRDKLNYYYETAKSRGLWFSVVPLERRQIPKSNKGFRFPLENVVIMVPAMLPFGLSHVWGSTVWCGVNLLRSEDDSLMNCWLWVPERRGGVCQTRPKTPRLRMKSSLSRNAEARHFLAGARRDVPLSLAEERGSIWVSPISAEGLFFSLISTADPSHVGAESFLSVGTFNYSTPLPPSLLCEADSATAGKKQQNANSVLERRRQEN